MKINETLPEINPLERFRIKTAGFVAAAFGVINIDSLEVVLGQNLDASPPHILKEASQFLEPLGHAAVSVGVVALAASYITSKERPLIAPRILATACGAAGILTSLICERDSLPADFSSTNSGTAASLVGSMWLVDSYQRLRQKTQPSFET